MKKVINWTERVSQNVKSLPPSGLKKFLEIINVNKNIISLGVGEPDFTIPKIILEKTISSMESGKTKYTSTYGMIELRQAICQQTEEEYGVSYNPEQEILITVGVSEGIDLIMRSMFSPGDEILMPEPCYVANKACILLAGLVPVGIKTTVENAFCVTKEDLEKNITTKTKAIIIGYPNNPTGATMNREQLQIIADVAEEHNLIVISDELYSSLNYMEKHISFPSLPRMKDRTIVLNGFSKAYAMTGLRLGFVLAPHEVIEAMVSIHQHTVLCAPVTAQYAALAAIQYGDKARDQMVDTYNKRRLIMVEGFKKIGLECFEPQGAFYIFPSIKSTGLTSMEFSEKLLLEQEVAVIPGSAFGSAGEGFVRCAYCNTTDNLKLALKRITTLVNTLQK